MVRTKADGARKAVAAKAPRKHLGASSAATRVGNSMKSPAGKKSKYAGGNSACPRATPDWQKEITNFMVRSPRSAAKQKENVNPDNEDDETAAGCSKEDRTEAAAGSSSTSRVEEVNQEMEDENQDEDEDSEEEDEETENAGASSTSSHQRKFVKNNCISDSEDDD